MITARTYGLVGPIGGTLPRGKLTDWRRRIDEEDQREVTACRLCLATGIALQAIVPVVAFGLCEILAQYAPKPPEDEAFLVAFMTIVICGGTLLAAAVTIPESRADIAQETLSRGLDAGADNGSAGAGLGAGLLMLIALYGGYAIVEATKRMWVRRKLRHANRLDAARVLSEVCAAPTGVPVYRLLYGRQSPLELRQSIALLLLDGWVDLCDGGRTLVQRSPAMRRLSRRHPLADVFSLSID